MSKEKLRIHSLRHVDFEDEANIGAWALENGHSLTWTDLHAGQDLPGLGSLDWLVIMGGPMNIYQEDRHPFLASEKRFIAEAVAKGKGVLGICLGAQLLSDVLGGAVTRNPYKEIGWLPVELAPAAAADAAFGALPLTFTAFHWHGDTFALPPGATPLASSQGCANQAFCFRGKAWGLQFHLETSNASMDRLIANCADDITEGPYVQPPEVMRAKAVQHLPAMETHMAAMLRAMAAAIGETA